jgi:hypothetical protein
MPVVDPIPAFADALAARWPALGLPGPALCAALGPALRSAADLRLPAGAVLDPADTLGVCFVLQGELVLRAAVPDGREAALRRLRAPGLLLGGDEAGARWVAWSPTHLRLLAPGLTEQRLAERGPGGDALRRLLARALSEGLLEMNLSLGVAAAADARDRGHLGAVDGG